MEPLKKKLRRFECHVLAGLLLVFFMSGCGKKRSKVSDETMYLQHCGSCHLPPDPANIPKSIWINDVLPEMASRLGYDYEPPNKKFDFFANDDIYTDEPLQRNISLIDSAEWNQIYNYVVTRAPDTIPVDLSRVGRTSITQQFSSEPISLDGNDGVSFISAIHFDSINRQFIFGDAYSESIGAWPFSKNTPKPYSDVIPFVSPVISYVTQSENTFVTEIGDFLPSDEAKGVLYQIKNGKVEVVIDQLYRPVFTKIEDLDSDGTDEIIVCEFGKRNGQLSMLVKSASGFSKRNLLNVPGTIKVEVVDMNMDGKKDIVVLASQGNEGIYILTNLGDLRFSAELVVGLGPEYGSSWFELIDYNGDACLDIVMVNGDNADLSVFPKPYHGVRLFLNDGVNHFCEKWFYPVYGATRVLAEDYDLDGDIDFAVMSFFPDYTAAPQEGFVYLKNIESDQYVFEASTFKDSSNGRWLVMDKGDIDEDGDVDIMLGSYTMRINRKHQDMMEKWANSRTNMLLLRNNAID